MRWFERQPSNELPHGLKEGRKHGLDEYTGMVVTERTQIQARRKAIDDVFTSTESPWRSQYRSPTCSTFSQLRIASTVVP